METLDSFITIAYVVTNVVSVGQAVASYRWPTVARIVFGLLFASAAFVNTRTVLDTPWVYQSYADYAIPLYSRFILGPFETIVQPMVLSIAIGQALIAGSMAMKGRWFRGGCLGGIVFCLAIAPLGLGSAFPATLLMAVAFYRLYSHGNNQHINEVVKKNQVFLPVD
ncbi:hypothetical protein GCM10028808_07900 [Spirosoma migulaei]